MAFVLYSTQACHLCELAEQVLQQAYQRQAFTVYVQDIAESEAWVAQFGELIPVFANENSSEQLHWPFNVEDVLQLIEKCPQ